MPEELSPQTTVSYTVREVLDEQTTLLRSIDHKVDGKADKADLIEVIHEVRGHGDRLTSLETWRAWNTKMWAAGGVILLACAGVLGSLISAHIL